MADTKQSNFETAQDFNLDIEKVYKDYISAIDKVRSCNVTTKIQKNDLDRIVNNSCKQRVYMYISRRCACSPCTYRISL